MRRFSVAFRCWLSVSCHSAAALPADRAASRARILKPTHQVCDGTDVLVWLGIRNNYTSVEQEVAVPRRGVTGGYHGYSTVLNQSHLPWRQHHRVEFIHLVLLLLSHPTTPCAANPDDALSEYEKNAMAAITCSAPLTSLGFVNWQKGKQSTATAYQIQRRQSSEHQVPTLSGYIITQFHLCIMAPRDSSNHYRVVDWRHLWKCSRENSASLQTGSRALLFIVKSLGY